MYCLASFSLAPQEAIRLQLFLKQYVFNSDRSQSRHVCYHNTLITIIEWLNLYVNANWIFIDLLFRPSIGTEFCILRRKWWGSFLRECVLCRSYVIIINFTLMFCQTAYILYIMIIYSNRQRNPIYSVLLSVYTLIITICLFLGHLICLLTIYRQTTRHMKNLTSAD